MTIVEKFNFIRVVFASESSGPVDGVEDADVWEPDFGVGEVDHFYVGVVFWVPVGGVGSLRLNKSVGRDPVRYGQTNPC